MSPPELIQGVFDFASGNADGFANWRREQEARLAAVRREWGVPVGRRVRLRLRDVDGEFVGQLHLAAPPKVIDRHQPLRLRLGAMDFSSVDLEQCAVLD